ncbi:MAG: pyridoxamine 5'-phosphate oxidase, partial [Thermomicrobiales bacterium]
LSNPFELFGQWLDAAIDEKLIEANAMIVATVSASGVPSTRTVLMKMWSQDGFVFGSNFSSQKGDEIALNPHVSLLFYWAALERQVRISGTCARCTDEESNQLFERRPVDARISATVSPQSQVIPDRAWLEAETAQLRQSLDPGTAPERPDFWGGYRVTATAFEFWQGRSNRMHDRIRYQLEGNAWKADRLAP